MDSFQDECSDKRRILSELSRCLETVFVEASASKSSSVLLKIDCSLINCVDQILQHGLSNLLQSYWPLVSYYSHTQTLQTVDNWLAPQSSHQNRGLVWVLATLEEGTLLSYLNCILSESQLIVRHYAPHAILRDPSCVSQLSSLLAGLESINFRIERSLSLSCASSPCLGLDKNASSTIKSVMELSLNGSKELQGTVMTSSMTSSLASPGDSGFTQLDSETDTASINEVLLDTESASTKEHVAVLQVDPCTPKTMKHCISSGMVIENEASKNLHSSLLGMESCDSDKVVYRRQKSKSIKSSTVKQLKRVSFHEDSSHVQINVEGLDEASHSKKPEGISSFKTSALNLSKAVGGFSSFKNEQEGVEVAGDLCLLGNEGIEELSVQNNLLNSKPVIFPKQIQDTVDWTLVAERGIPEGQEDPPKRWSMSTPISDQPSFSLLERLQSSSNLCPAASCSSLTPQFSTPRKLSNASSFVGSASCLSSVLSQTPSKACLVKKFLRSITEKKISNSRSAAVLAAVKRRNSPSRNLILYINGAKPNKHLSQELLQELREEVDNFFRKAPSHLSQSKFILYPSSSLRNFLYNCLKIPCSENIAKILKIRSTSVDKNGERESNLAVVTDQALYIVGNEIHRNTALLHTELSSVLVGPNAQWVSLLSNEKRFQINLLLGDRNLLSELVGGIELFLHQRVSKPLQLPGIFNLMYNDYFRTPQWKKVLQGEQVYHYSVVHALEEFSTTLSSPSEAFMKSYFMFRVLGTNSSWEPGFFILKDSFLLLSSDEEEMLPLLSINLEGVHCRFVTLSSRPHTIEVGNVQIAAPDDYVARNWLVALQKQCSDKVLKASVKSKVISGSLILTESRIILMNSFGIPNEDLDSLGQPFLTAFVSDISSFQVGEGNASWGFMEFSCREVHDSGGDFVLFFSTSCEMMDFRERLRLLHPLSLQECVVLSNMKQLYRRCSLVAASLSSAWDFIEMGHPNMSPNSSQI